MSKKGFIYKYTFPNGKIYIGQTRVSVDKRHYQHVQLSKDPTKSRLCEKAIAKYGEPLLEIIETIEVDDDKEIDLRNMLNNAENKWIKEYDSESPINGYNVKRGGKREGSGRKPIGISTHPMSVKFDLDLFEVLSSKDWNKNRYINEAVRAAMKMDGLI